MRNRLQSLQAADEEVYARLTRREHVRPEDADSIERLREHHLVEHDPHSPETPLTLDPCAAKNQTVTEVHDRIIEDLSTLRDLTATYQRLAAAYSQASAAGGVGGVRLLDRPELANAAIGQSMSRPHTAIYTAQPTQRSPEVLEKSRARDGAILRRGIRMYTIYPQSARTREPEIQWAEEMASLGAEIRTSALPFHRIILIDGVAAYVEEPPSDGLAYYDTGVRPAIEITHPSAVIWVKSLFMLWWKLAQPWTSARTREQGTGGTLTTARERAILRMLESDATRTAIARDLDVSERTITNTLKTLREKFGVDSEFALATRWRVHPEYNLP
jgi:DNA-binding CsgD family transcriptional regulator